MITYSFLQHYWWILISILGAVLVFMLFVQGGHDYQVTKEDFDLWRTALEQSHQKAEFHYFDTLDHLMRPLPRMAVPANYYEPGIMSHDVTTLIGNFVKN